MATKSVKTTRKTTAPKVSRARKTEVPAAAEMMTQPAHESASVPGCAEELARHDRIAIRAYEMWCARGYQHGHDVEDWLAAERELMSA